MISNQNLFVEVGQGLSIMVGLPTITIWETNTRPIKPKEGTFGFNSQTNNLEYWDGVQWMGASME